MTNKKSRNFFQRRRNSIIGLLIVFAVLLGGYFLVRATLLDSGDTPVTTTSPSSQTLMPGEALYGSSTLIYPQIPKKELKSVEIHNPQNAVLGEQYVDWGVGFAYDETENNSYGFLLYYGDEYELDEFQLTYLAAAAGTLSIASRVEEHCTDFSPYGLDYASPEDAISMKVTKTDGTVHTVYFGNKNPSGSGYYVRCMDEVTDSEGKTYVRDTVYLLASSTTTYCADTILAAPVNMLTTLITYPIASSFSYFALSSADGSLDVSFILADALSSVEGIFGGSSLYKALTPAGYYSSSTFETYITRFEYFAGEAVVEYATKKVEGVDENGEAYSFYTFDEETFAKYGLEEAQYFMTYVAYYEDVGENVESSAYFSALQPDGYYYAYSLNYGTILRVQPVMLDFLNWSKLDFVDSYILRMSIFHAEEITLRGKIDGEPYEETFRATSKDNTLQTVTAVNLGSEVSNTYYTELFRELYTTILRGEVPLNEEEKTALMQNEPYMEIEVKTPKITVYVQDENGNDTTKVDRVLPGATRVLRFYRYSNNRAMMTVEMIDSNGVSSGEDGTFYVLVSRLDKLIKDTKNLCDGIPFSYHDKE